jgi:uncharacterized protein (UPF0264 family)
MRLLVSVRNAAEAELALAGGVDFIDVKEPDRGPLGRADWEVIRAVVDCVAGRAKLSAALGEIVDWRASDAARLPLGLDFVKFGLEGCGLLPAWRECWRRTVESLAGAASVVPVAYADHRTAIAPCFEEVIEAATQSGGEAVLMDTFDKSGPGLLEICSPAELQAFIEQARSAGLLSLVAGKLDAAAIEQITPWQVDVIGVRGAVCEGGRTGRLDAERVRSLAALLQRAGRSKPLPAQQV